MIWHLVLHENCKICDKNVIQQQKVQFETKFSSQFHDHSGLLSIRNFIFILLRIPFKLCEAILHFSRSHHKLFNPSLLLHLRELLPNLKHSTFCKGKINATLLCLYCNSRHDFFDLFGMCQLIYPHVLSIDKAKPTVQMHFFAHVIDKGPFALLLFQFIQTGHHSNSRKG